MLRGLFSGSESARAAWQRGETERNTYLKVRDRIDLGVALNDS